MPTLIQRAQALLGPEAELTAEGHIRVREPSEDEDPSALILQLEEDQPHTLTLEMRHPDGYSTDGGYDDSAQIDWMTGLLERLAGAPSAQLRALRVVPKYDYFGDIDRSWLAEALSQMDLSGLRTLSWGNEEVPCFVEVPNLDALRAAAPALEALHLMGDWEDENPELATAGLRRLSLLALRPSMTEAIADMALDSVQALRLRLSDDEDEGGEELWVEDLEPLFDRVLPALRRLSLTHCPFGPGLIDALPEAAWFGQLKHLSLFDARDGVSYLPESCALALLSPAYARLSVDVTGAFGDPSRAPSALVKRLMSRSDGRITRSRVGPTGSPDPQE